MLFVIAIKSAILYPSEKAHPLPTRKRQKPIRPWIPAKIQACIVLTKANCPAHLHKVPKQQCTLTLSPHKYDRFYSA